MFDDLEVFVRVAERGSFSVAAKALGIPKSTASRTVQRLEATLGLTLLRRAGRIWSLTQDGQMLVERSRAPLRELAAVRDAVLEAGETPKGTLRLAIPIEFAGARAVATLLADYTNRFPNVDMELLVDDRLADLVEEGVDIALRGHTGQLASRAGVIARHLATIDAGLFASTSYVDARGLPQEVADLEGHDLLAPGLAVFGASWPFTEQALGSPLGFSPRAKLRSNEFRSLLAAAAAGLGVTPCPLFLANEDLEAGRIVRVLPEVVLRAGSVSALWPHSRNLSPRIRSMVDFLVERFASALAEPPLR